MNKKRLYYSILMCCFLAHLSAQEARDSLKCFPAQISVFHPVGTHGRQSVDYTYNFSLNIFTGKVGGIRGLQVSGLWSDFEGDTHSVHGIQIAGLASSTVNIKGIQIGGLGYVEGNMKGIQIGGLSTVFDNMKGIQIGGIGNLVENMKGIQIGGLANGARKMEGVQISGLNYNITTFKGLQIGLVSINDTIEKGISLSLVNITKRGFYREWGLSFSDYSHVALNYKMGIQKFYSIYTIGANFMDDNLWMVGLGFGNRTPIGNRFAFQPELVSYYYFPTNFKNVQSTFSTHLKFGFVYRITEKYALSLAPSVYVMNAKKDSNPDSEFYKVSPFDALYTNDRNNRQITIGVGISLGLVFCKSIGKKYMNF